MATRVTTKMVQIYEQYSKKMATRVTIFWMIYRILVATFVFFKPDVANALIHLTEGADTVMIVNMGTYTANSGTEKVAIAFGKRDVRLKDSSGKSKDKDEEEDEDEENG